MKDYIKSYFVYFFEMSPLSSMERDFSFEKKLVRFGLLECYLRSNHDDILEIKVLGTNPNIIGKVSNAAVRMRSLYFSKEITNCENYFNSYPINLPILIETFWSNFYNNPKKRITFDNFVIKLEKDYKLDNETIVVDRVKRLQHAKRFNEPVVITNNVKKSIILSHSAVSYRLINYSPEILDNPVYNIDNLKEKEIVIVTDCLDLAIYNNDLIASSESDMKTIAWISPMRMDLLDNCEFSQLSGKEIYYFFCEHSKLSQVKLRDNLREIYSIMTNQKVGNIQIVYTCSSSFIFKEVQKYEAASYVEFNQMLDMFEKPSLPVSVNRSENYRLILKPFLYSGTTTLIHGQSGSGRRLLGLFIAYAVQNKLDILRNWKANGQIQKSCCIPLGVSLNKQEQLVKKALIMDYGHLEPVEMFQNAESFSKFNLNRISGKYDRYDVVVLFVGASYTNSVLEMYKYMERSSRAIIIVLLDTPQELKKHNFDNIIKLRRQKKTSASRIRSQLKFEKVFCSKKGQDNNFMFEVDTTVGKERFRKVHKKKSDWSYGAKKYTREEQLVKIHKLRIVEKRKIHEVAAGLKMSESLVKKRCVELKKENLRIMLNNLIRSGVTNERELVNKVRWELNSQKTRNELTDNRLF